MQETVPACLCCGFEPGAGLLDTVDKDEGPKPLTCPWEVAGGDWAPLAAQISELLAVGRWSAGGRFSCSGVAFTGWPCSCASALPRLSWAVLFLLQDRCPLQPFPVLGLSECIIVGLQAVLCVVPCCRVSQNLAQSCSNWCSIPWCLSPPPRGTVQHGVGALCWGAAPICRGIASITDREGSVWKGWPFF